MTLDLRTLVHRGGAGDDLCEKLGIPAQPVIEWHRWALPEPVEPPVDPDPPPPGGRPERIHDDFNRADGPLNGTLSTSGHRWVAPTSCSLVNGRAHMAGLASSTQIVKLSSAVGDLSPISSTRVITLTADVGVVSGDPASTQFWLQPVVTANDRGITVVLRDEYAVAYSTNGTVLTVVGDPFMYAPMVTGAPLRQFRVSYDRLTGDLNFWIDGVLQGTRTAPEAVRTTLTASGQPYLRVAQTAAILVHVVDNVAILEQDAPGPYPDPEPEPEPEPDPEPPAPTWVLDPDRTAALTHYTASYGRQNPTGNTEPLQIGTGLVEALAGDQLPTIGERFRLTIAAPVATALGLADDDRPRFTGEVTDVDVDTEGLIALAGVGRAGRLGRVPVGGTRWPAESIGNRVARILAAVSTRLPLDLGTLDAGGPQLLARPGAAQPAGQLLEQVSAATTGQLVEQRTGQLEWHNETHRRNPVSALTLAAAELLKPFRWAQRVGTVVNDARVTYGDPQATVAVTDPTSTDPAEGLGPYPVAIATELADQADAYALGSVIVGRRATPTWELPQVTVDLVRTAGDKAGAVLALRHGHMVTTTGLPAIGPYTVRDVFVEGATETFTRTSWQLSLTVADKALAGVALRWVDIPAGETWDTITPTLTWLGAATAASTDL